MFITFITFIIGLCLGVLVGGKIRYKKGFDAGYLMALNHTFFFPEVDELNGDDQKRYADNEEV